jgi:hypothetical protein
VTPAQLPIAPLSKDNGRRPGAVERDCAIAVVGGLVLCFLALWFWRQAVLIESDTTTQDYYFSKARSYGSVGMLALAPGFVFGRIVVFGAAVLYLVGSLALIMLDV